MSITINSTQRLFVIPCGDGFSCLGFDVCFSRLAQLGAKLLSKFNIIVDDFKESEIGTIKQYQQYLTALDLVGSHNLGTFFSIDTPKKVQTILENYRRSGDKLRIIFGDLETGRDWLSENDVMGRVGRSTGMMKIPLMVADGENGGSGILDNSILRMLDVASRKVLYCHPKYQVPDLAITTASADAIRFNPKYTHGVSRDGSNFANFTSMAKAAQYVAFLCGECMERPN